MPAGDLEYLTNVTWPIPLYGFATGVLAGLVQAFLVFRYWRLLWLATDAAVDVGIASVLLWEFRKAKAIVRETQRRVICHFIYLPGSGINSALSRLTAVAIQSGAAAATLAGGV
ncbi:hypothetical protein B0H19DRAFT_1082470 [Mycena capillaripes]|nr:hypothetical protein B0H19DRAFT_1082470 [Mycena capillaripes]